MMSTIVYVGGFELPDKNAAAERVRANALILRDLGYRVILLGVGRGHSDVGKLHPVDPGVPGIDAYEIGYPNSMLQWFNQIISANAFSCLLKSLNVSDLCAVICYNHPAISQLRIANLARRHGAVAIADCTEWYSDMRNTNIANIVKNVDVELRMKWVNRKMDGLITTSPMVSKFYSSIGKPLVELPTLMTNEQSVVPESKRTSDNRLRLFYAGTGFDRAQVAKQKDGLKDRLDWVIELLFEAKKRGARFHLDLYGVDYNKYVELLPEQKALIDFLGDWLVFHGRQPRAVLLTQLPQVAYSIFFRKATRTTLAGFPTKFSESVTFGTPVITNVIPSIEAYAREGLTGAVLDLDDREQAVNKLIELLNKSDTEINQMKTFCSTSNIFSYKTFQPEVLSFMSALGV